MRNRTLPTVAAASVLLLALSVTGAQAADSTTDTTFTLDSTNTLAVSADATDDLGTINSGALLGTITAETAYSGTFTNPVSVEDSRTGLLRSFNVTVTATSPGAIAGAAFELVSDLSGTTFTASAGETSTWIPANDKTQYQWGTLTDVVGSAATGGLLVATNGDVDGANVDGDLTNDDATLTATGVSETIVVEWTPTIEVTVPPEQMAGKYQGTITHSVS